MVRMLAATLAGMVLVAGCDVDQTESGELPDVDVDVAAEEGDLPEYDVDWMDVDVGTRTETVTVPKLVVVQEEETVEVPYIDVTGPEAGERVERTLSVETEVPHAGYSIDIRRVVAHEGDVYVVAELMETDAQAPQQRVRIADQVMLNAPDADVHYLIVGDRPEGGFNDRFEYVGDETSLPMAVRNGRVLYEAG